MPRSRHWILERSARRRRQAHVRQPRAEKLDDRLLLATDVFTSVEAAVVLEIGGTGGERETVQLIGSSTVQRDDIPADRVGNNGLEDVNLELTELQLTGVSSVLGPISIELAAGGPRNLGFAEEASNQIPQQLESPIFSLLAMFPQLRAVEAGIDGVTVQPVALRAALDQLPPAEGESFQFTGSAQLIDSQTRDPLPIAIVGLTQTFVSSNRFIETDVFENTTAIIELVGGPVGNVPTTFILRGAATAEVRFDGLSEGSALDDNPADGLEEVAQQVTSLALANADASVRLSQSPTRVSRGQITEQANTTPGTLDVSPFTPSGAATSQVDLFFVLDAFSGQFHNAEPLQLEATIYEKPGFRRHVHQPDTLPIELLNAEGNPSGIRILKAEYHTGFTEIDALDESVGHLLVEQPATSDQLQSGVASDQADFPDLDGVLRSPLDEQFAFLSGDVGLSIQDVRIQPTEIASRTDDGGDQVAIFNVSVQLLGELIGGPSDGATRVVTLQGTARTRLLAKTGNTTGSFTAELEALDAAGTMLGSTIVLRLDPANPSLGSVVVGDLGDGRFQTDSFFDVRPQLSVDGATFASATQPLRLNLTTVPRPTLVSTTGSSLLAVHFEGPNEGDAKDEQEDGLGRDEVPAEFVAFDLRGQTSRGPLRVQQRPGFFSAGQIEEVNFNDQPGLLQVPPFDERPVQTAFGSFEAWTQFDWNGESLVTAEPFQLDSFLGHKPPIDQERFTSSEPRIVPLFAAESGEFSGIYVHDFIHQTSSTVEHDFFPVTVGQLLLDVRGTQVLIPTFGQSQIDVLFEGSAEGAAIDDDRNGLDEVAAELVSLELAGSTPLGPIRIELDPETPSMGQIEELVDNTTGLLDIDPFARGDATSYFDLSLIVNLNGRRLTPAAPPRLSSTLQDKPPGSGERYLFAPSEPIELLDAATGQGTGIFLLRQVHEPASTVAHELFPDSQGQFVFETPPASGVPSPVPVFPPAGITYRSENGNRVVFPGPAPILLQNPRLRPVGEVTTTVSNQDEIQQFEARLRGTALVGGQQVEFDLLGEIRTISRGKAGATTGSWETEIISMDLRGDVPAGPQIALRESPAIASTGLLTILPNPGGGFQIESFFDLFAEISVNGGQLWIPGATSVRLEATAVGIDSTTPIVAPAGSIFDGLRDPVYSSPTTQFILQHVRAEPVGSEPPVVVGQDQRFRFTTSLTAIALGSSGVPTPIELRGPTELVVRGRTNDAPGVYDAEITSLELTGMIGDQAVILRQSPNRPSLGTTTITDLGGVFHVETQLDVFTELSNNGGVTFVPAAQSTPIELNRKPQQIVVDTSGTSGIDVYFEGDREGVAADDDGDGRDEVPAQLVDLNLAGESPFGRVEAQLNRSIPPLGMITEQTNDIPGLLDLDPYAAGDADSYFDVALQFNVGGRVLIPLTPTSRWEGALLDQPPGSSERYRFDPAAPIPLIDAATGQPSGFTLVREEHQPAPPQQLTVSQFTPTPSGFVAEFSGPLDPAPLNLIDSRTAGLGEADIVFRSDTTGIVAGTLVLNDTGTRATFIKTGDPLVPGNYAVIFRSSEDGFRDRNGNLLDGNDDGTAGDNFVATFVVPPSEAGLVVSVPDFVRGPGQDVELPASSTAGIPIRLSDAEGVRQLALTLNYDPARLEISGARLAAGLPLATTLDIDLTTPGAVTLSLTSSADLSSGPLDVIHLDASVPENNASQLYNSKQNLVISGLSVRDGSGAPLTAVADQAVHVVSYLGDVSGNGRINASDASRIARVAALVDGGFDAYQLADPIIIGDVSGNGRINASDASRVARFAALFPVPEIPPVPRGVLTGPLTGGPDPELKLDRTLVAAPGEAITVPLHLDSLVNLQSPHGLVEANVLVEFDPQVLTATTVTAGAFLQDTSPWTFTSQIDQELGLIAIVAFSPTPTTGKFADILVDLHFRVAETAPNGPTPLNLLDRKDDFRTQLIAQNDDLLPLAGPITNGQNDPVDGLLWVEPATTQATAVAAIDELLGEEVEWQ